jgi:N-acetyl-gamma-glutamyl-phosphate reductase
MKKIRVGVIGGAGYTAGELLRILIYHPQVEIIFVNSSSNNGNRITDVHSGLIGETNLAFSSEMNFEQVDVLFLCSAHGDSKKFMESNDIPNELKIIDLSTDYREKRPDHDFVYGLPEVNRSEIASAKHIANPGCFATAIQLALLPMASAGILMDDIHVNAITGSTGAGVKPSSTTHFSWRNNNISIYKPFTHQHLQEIEQTFRQLQHSFNSEINFIPVRGNFARGIYATTYLKTNISLNQVRELYHNFYKDAAFTFFVDKNPDMKQVVNTNKALVYIEMHGSKLLIVSVIDNLLKGASGQAVQNMNLMFGLDEKIGLGLKSIGF